MPDFFTSITAGNETKTVQDPNAVQTVGKGVNLLDNWYFVYGKAINNDYSSAGTFPINQRGQQTYSAIGYGIDRWKNEYTAPVTVQSDGIHLTTNGAFADNRLYQALEHPEAFYGKQLTLTMLYKTNGVTKILGKTITIPNNSWIDDSTNDGKWVIGAYNYGVRIYNMATDSPELTLIAVKLELGTQQTLARQVNGAWVLNDPPPNYDEQMMRCCSSLADPNDTYANSPYNYAAVRSMSVSGTTDAVGNALVTTDKTVKPIVFVPAVGESYNGFCVAFISSHNGNIYVHAANWNGAAQTSQTIKGTLYYVKI